MLQKDSTCVSEFVMLVADQPIWGKLETPVVITTSDIPVPLNLCRKVLNPSKKVTLSIPFHPCYIYSVQCYLSIRNSFVLNMRLSS